MLHDRINCLKMILIRIMIQRLRSGADSQRVSARALYCSLGLHKLGNKLRSCLPPLANSRELLSVISTQFPFSLPDLELIFQITI